MLLHRSEVSPRGDRIYTQVYKNIDIFPDGVIVKQPTNNSGGMQMSNTDMKSQSGCQTAIAECDKTDFQVKTQLEELEEMERTIINGIQTFMSVGTCLAEISKRKLYKLRGFSSFGEYCEVQFNISRSHGYRQIAHAVTCQNIGENPAGIPEKVIRPLTRIDDPETAKRLWLEAKAESTHEIPTSKEVEHKVFCFGNNVSSQPQDIPTGTTELESVFAAPAADVPITPEKEPSAEVYCQELKRDFSLQHLSEELIAEIDKLTPSDENATATEKLLNQADKLSSAAYELRIHLSPRQRNAIRAAYQRLTGQLIDAWMAAPAETDSVTSDHGTGSAPERA